MRSGGSKKVTRRFITRTKDPCLVKLVVIRDMGFLWRVPFQGTGQYHVSRFFVSFTSYIRTPFCLKINSRTFKNKKKNEISWKYLRSVIHRCRTKRKSGKRKSLNMNGNKLWVLRYIGVQFSLSFMRDDLTHISIIHVVYFCCIR